MALQARGPIAPTLKDISIVAEGHSCTRIRKMLRALPRRLSVGDELVGGVVGMHNWGRGAGGEAAEDRRPTVAGIPGFKGGEYLIKGGGGGRGGELCEGVLEDGEGGETFSGEGPVDVSGVGVAFVDGVFGKRREFRERRDWGGGDSGDGGETAESYEEGGEHGATHICFDNRKMDVMRRRWL